MSEPDAAGPSEAEAGADPVLETVVTRKGLAQLLRELHIDADRPSTRDVQKWANAHGTIELLPGVRSVGLSPATQSELRNAKRLPSKAVVLTFVRACGVQDTDRLAEWEKAWQRVARREHKRLAAVAAAEVEAEEILRDAGIEAERILAGARKQAAAIEAEAESIARVAKQTARAQAEQILEGAHTRAAAIEAEALLEAARKEAIREIASHPQGQRFQKMTSSLRVHQLLLGYDVKQVDDFVDAVARGEAPAQVFGPPRGPVQVRPKPTLSGS